MRSDLIDIEMKLHHQTQWAILVSDDGDHKNAVWIPKSQCEFVETKPGIVTVTLSERTATENGLV